MKVSAFGRQMLRDERAPRIKRILSLSREVHRCLEAKAYDAAVAMQFIELDTWAYLTRPASLTRHGRTSFKLFVERFLRDEPGQGYSYQPADVYAARCALLHTFGSLAAAMHSDGSDAVVWRYHLGKMNTLVPGLSRMAYISVVRFILDSQAAMKRALETVRADDELGRLFGDRLPRHYFLAGVLPSRDPDAMPELDAIVDAEIAAMKEKGDARQ